MKTILENAKIFVQPYYNRRDIMHGWKHIERIIRKAFEISVNYQVDISLISFWAYFHWMIWLHENEIREFLKSEWIENSYIEKIIQVTWDSNKDSIPETLEWKILYDAHLLEWWRTFQITKSFITGTSRWQTLEETIAFMKDNVFGKYNCYLPESQELYKEKEKFAIDFVAELEKNL